MIHMLKDEQCLFWSSLALNTRSSTETINSPTTTYSTGPTPFISSLRWI